MKRVTITIPNYLYTQLLLKAPKRGVSQYISSAVEAKISKSLLVQGDPWDNFLNAHKLITVTNKISIKEAINKGRKY